MISYFDARSKYTRLISIENTRVTDNFSENVNEIMLHVIRAQKK